MNTHGPSRVNNVTLLPDQNVRRERCACVLMRTHAQSQMHVQYKFNSFLSSSCARVQGDSTQLTSKHTHTIEQTPQWNIFLTPQSINAGLNQIRIIGISALTYTRASCVCERASSRRCRDALHVCVCVYIHTNCFSSTPRIGRLYT